MLDFDRLLAQQAATLGAITRFMGVPALPDARLPHDNERYTPHKVVTIDCATLRLLSSLYAPWNALLVDLLRQDQQAGGAPPEEPPFGGFVSQVPCQEGAEISAKQKDRLATLAGLPSPRAPAPWTSRPAFVPASHGRWSA